MQMDTTPQRFCTVESLLASERQGVLAGLRIASPDINYRMRAILVDWMMEVSKIFKLRTESFFASVVLVDSVIARYSGLKTSELQLYGVTALWLAAKYHEIYPPDIGDVIFVCDNAFTAQQILEAEIIIFKIVGCNVNVPDMLQYLRVISNSSGSTTTSHNTAKGMLYLLSLRSTMFLPSVVVSAVRWLLAIVYNEQYVNAFEVPRNVVTECVREVLERVSNAQNGLKLLAHTKTMKGQDRAEYLRVLRVLSTALPPRIVLSNLTPYICNEFYAANLSLNLLSPAIVPADAPTLGAGTFGIVKRAEYDGKMFAVKQLNDNTNIYASYDGVPASFLRETSIMQSLHHPNIAQVRHITSDLQCIFLDLGKSDLDAWLGKNGPADHAMQMQIAIQLLEALAYLHDIGCLHRDIKPKNIIVFDDVRLQLSDFGSGRGCQIALRGLHYTAGMCTLPYRSPEVLLGTAVYDDGLDCWSMLCTLYECATGVVPFGQHTHDEIIVLLGIFSVLGTPTEDTWPGVREMIGYPDAAPESERRVDILSGDQQPSPCYRELMETGLVLNPAHRPRAHELLAIAQKYV